MFEVVKVPVSHFLPFIRFLLGLLYVCTVCSSFPLAPYPPCCTRGFARTLACAAPTL
jgi:hypothetical protein